MYELTCPHCAHVSRSAFVRIGAVVECPSCGKVINIETRDVRRRVAAATAQAAAGQDPLVGERMPPVWGLPAVEEPQLVGAAADTASASATASPSTARRARRTPPPAPGAAPPHHAPPAPAEPEPVPIEAVTQAVQAEAPAAAYAESTDPAAQMASAAARADVDRRREGRQLALLKERKRRRMTMLLVSSTMTIALLGMVAGLYYLLNHTDANTPSTPGGDTPGPVAVTPGSTPGSTPGTTPGTTPSTTPGTTPNTTPGTTPLVGTTPGTTPSGVDPLPGPDREPPQLRAEMLVAPMWAAVDEPAPPPTTPVGPVQVVDQRFVPEPTDNVRFEADVTVAADQGAAQGTVTLDLVDWNNRVFARALVPVQLVAPGVNQPIRLNIPNGLVERAERLNATADVTARIASPVRLEDIRVENRQHPRGALLLVKAVNRQVQPLRNAAFIIQAIGDSDAVLAQWHVDWRRPIEPAATIEFKSIVEVDAALAPNIRQWRAIGVAQP